jgi:hypothetical protein
VIVSTDANVLKVAREEKILTKDNNAARASQKKWAVVDLHLNKEVNPRGNCNIICVH